jgi:hypothetical protein
MPPRANNRVFEERITPSRRTLAKPHNDTTKGQQVVAVAVAVAAAMREHVHESPSPEQPRRHVPWVL